MNEWQQANLERANKNNAWVAGVCAALGKEWSPVPRSKEETNADWYTSGALGPDGMRLHFHFAHGRETKVQISGVLPSGRDYRNGEDFLRREEKPESISVSMGREFKFIAADIQRRLFPTYVTALALVKARIESDARTHDNTARLEAEFIKRVPHRFNYVKNRQERRSHKYGIEIGTHGDNANVEITSGSYTMDGKVGKTEDPSVNVEIRMSPELFAKLKEPLIAFLKDFARKAPKI